MNNTAEVFVEDDAVVLIGHIKQKSFLKIVFTLIVLGIFVLYTLLLVLRFSDYEPPKGGELLMLTIVTPAALIYFLVRPLLWNLYGKEEVKLKEKEIHYRRHYGVLATQWKIEHCEPLYYEVKEEQRNVSLSTIKFAGNTTMGVLHFFYKLAVYVPTEQLRVLIRHYKQKFDKAFISLNDFNINEEYVEDVYDDLNNRNPNYPIDGEWFLSKEDILIALEEANITGHNIIEIKCRNHINENIETKYKKDYPSDIWPSEFLHSLLKTYPDDYTFSFTFEPLSPNVIQEIYQMRQNTLNIDLNHFE